MAYASGKYAYFICDTCGFRYPYKEAEELGKTIEFVMSVMNLNTHN